ncbi:MAG: hypothetical protein ACKOX6_02860 [Bdellovibrio sp.]
MLAKLMILGSLLVSTIAHADFGKREAITDITNDMVAKMVHSIRSAGGTTANAKNIHMQVTYKGQNTDGEVCKVNYEYNYNIIWRDDEKSNKNTLWTKETVIISATGSDSSSSIYEPIVRGLPRFNLKNMDYNSANHSFVVNSVSEQRSAGLGDVLGSLVGVPFDPGHKVNYTTTLSFDDNNMVRAYEIVDHLSEENIYLCVIDNSRPVYAEGRIINDDQSYGGGFALNSDTGRFEQWKAAY